MLPTYYLTIAQVQDLDLHKKALAFVKAVPEPLTDANIMTSVFIISVQGSVAHMFYSVIDSFYAPLLMKVIYFFSGLKYS